MSNIECVPISHLILLVRHSYSTPDGSLQYQWIDRLIEIMHLFIIIPKKKNSSFNVTRLQIVKYILIQTC